MRTRGPGLGLPIRITAMLTLAMLPLGYLGVIQTTTLADSAENHLRLSLIAKTEAHTQIVTQRLERAFGTIEALGGIARQFSDRPDLCSEAMAAVLEEEPSYGMAGYMEAYGQTNCISSFSPQNFREHPGRAALVRGAKAVVRPLLYPNIGADSFAMVFWPVHDANENLLGFSMLSVPLPKLTNPSPDTLAPIPLGLTIYTSEQYIIQANARAPDIPLDAVSGVPVMPMSPQTQEISDENGTPGIMVVQPIIPGKVYAAATWPHQSTQLALFGVPLPTPLFPVLMWLASLAVAYLAIHRLVVRHVQRLGHQMQVFGRHRTITKPLEDAAIPAEIRALEASFQGMALDLISEEARMEDALREKNILIKEVHHRVKNNLQLISSIMNLQLRDTDSQEAQAILTRLQDRVRGLATVYGYLYEADGIESTSAAKLLTDVFGQALDPELLPGLGVTVRQSFADARLTADQAVPLALLASELGNNALRSVMAAPNQDHLIDLSFRINATGFAELRCSHPVSDMDAERAAGLSQKLVRAFAQQLDAHRDTKTENGRLTVTVAFPLQQQTFEDRSY